MKIKHILALFILGFIATSTGAFLKILHYSYAVEMLTIGIILKIIAGVLVIIKLLSSDKIKEFLNW